MASRAELFTKASLLLLDGESVDIIGDRGSGRTRFLEQLHSLAANRGWRTLHVQGNASFRQNPLAALAIAGVTVATDQRLASIPAAVSKLVETFSNGQAAIFVDDWDDLDEASWGVITSVQRQTGVPVVLSRVRGKAARQTPTGLSSSSIDMAYLVDIGSMRYDELAEAIKGEIGHSIEEGTMSRIYAKSGGLIGLALMLALSAVRENKMTLRDGVWVASQDLWSNALGTIVESLLEPLNANERDALEEFSLLGIVDVETVENVVDFAVIESLEAKSLLELYPAGTQTLVTVRPPLLVEYFRHLPVAARRHRLQRRLAELFDPSRNVSTEAVSIRPGDHSAMFVRFVHEQARMRRLIAAAEWTRTPNAQTALAYLDALHRAAGSADEIEELMRWTPSANESELQRARWHRATLEHGAYERDKAADAVDRLRQSASAYPVAGGLLLAGAAILEQSFLRDTDLSVLPDPTDIDLDPLIRIEVFTALAYVHCCRGEFEASLAALDQIRELSEPNLGVFQSVIGGLSAMGMNDVSEARRIAERGLDEARGRFDATMLRGYGFLGAVIAMLDGRISDADEIVESVLILGDPVSTPPFAQVGLMSMAVVVAARRGQRKQAMNRMAELERLPFADGALPGTMRTWARMSLEIAAGDRELAVAQGVKEADDAWDRGAKSTAAYAYLTSLEVSPNRELFDVIAPRVRSIGSPFCDEFLTFLEALVDDDATRLEAIAKELEESRPMRSVIAYGAAARAYRTTDADRAEQLRRHHDELYTSLPPGADDPDTRFEPKFVELTSRELQIAQLAATGMTNQQIADELVLSVRTVESHVHRVMRKTGAARRFQLKDFLDNTESGQL